MFQPDMDHHQATLVILGDDSTIHFVLSTFRHIAVFVCVVNWLRRMFSSYLLSGRFSVFDVSFTLVVCALVLFVPRTED
jgi:hypothetical protein